MSKKVLTIGGAMYDIFIEHRAAQTLEMHTDFGSQRFIILEEGHKVEIDGIIYTTGGGATNSAVNFQQLGNSVACVFKVGDDHPGTFIRTQLNQAGIDIAYTVTSKTAPTGTSFMIPCPSGNRAILVHRAANLTLAPDDIPFERFGTYDVLYCTSLGGETSHLLEPIAKRAKRDSLHVAVNPGTSQLRAGAEAFRQALPFIDTLILNAHEAEYLFTSMVYASTPTITIKPISTTQQVLPELLKTSDYEHAALFNMLDFFDLMHKTGPSLVVLTNGSEGVYVSTTDHVYFHPSLPVESVCSVGAGDAFSSTFVAYIRDDNSIEVALRAGICNAASVIQHTGAKKGLLTKKELTQKIATLDPSLLYVYKKQS